MISTIMLKINVYKELHFGKYIFIRFIYIFRHLNVKTYIKYTDLYSIKNVLIRLMDFYIQMPIKFVNKNILCR